MRLNRTFFVYYAGWENSADKLRYRALATKFEFEKFHKKSGRRRPNFLTSKKFEGADVWIILTHQQF